MKKCIYLHDDKQQFHLAWVGGGGGDNMKLLG